MVRNNIDFRDWPAQSPDHNLIEHFWDALGRQIGSRAFPNNDQLRQHLQEHYQRVYISKLVETTSRHVEALIKVRGGNT
jgi:hypothetical protein